MPNVIATVAYGSVSARYDARHNPLADWEEVER